MKVVSVVLDGRLVHSYPITSDGEYIGGPLTTDEEYAAAARASVVEEGRLSAEDAARADYVVEGRSTEPTGVIAGM